MYRTPVMQVCMYSHHTLTYNHVVYLGGGVPLDIWGEVGGNKKSYIYGFEK